jgi:hypothetical protein
MSAIRFEGNESFDREQFLTAVKFDFDVQAAAHPLAPLSNLIAVVEQKILSGYRRAGLPDASRAQRKRACSRSRG